MATLSTGLQGAMLDGPGFGAFFDQGALANPAKLEILHSDGTTVLVTFNLPADPFPASSGSPRSISLSGTPISATASATGTATTARLRGPSNTTGNIEIDGMTVGTSGTQIVIDNTSINSGQNVNLNSFTVTAPSTA
ncbi:MAG: hypothetical protein KatS3mg104_2962 [Phycisphaerae bacterium]|nr:MAG: hypothetical protein KatS3mg104_2962 [Phycisphaerae bacterium]